MFVIAKTPRAKTGWKLVLASALCAGFLQVTSAQAAGNGMKAGDIVDKLDSGEISAYISGLVEGIAFAQYLKEGKNEQGGMRCILDWYYEGQDAAKRSYLALAHYKDHPANAVIAALLRKECNL